jgi:anthranilate phosphoribosyltransferase
MPHSGGGGAPAETRQVVWHIRETGSAGVHQKPSAQKKGAQMAYAIDCVDGMQVRGETMDELRTNTEKHVAEYHQGEDLDLEAIMATAREE